MIGIRPSARALGRRERAPETTPGDPPIASVEDAEAILAEMAQAFSMILRPDGAPARTAGEADAETLAEKQRWKAEARYRSLVEQIPAVTFMAALDEDLHEFYVSPQIEALLGFSQEEWLSNPFLWFRQLHPDDRDRCHLEFARGCRTGGPFRAEFRALTRAGGIVWVRGEARVVRDELGNPLFIQGIAYDITESKRAEEAVRASADQVEASLREKEVLLEEIHHRVKNNLQVISSLLRLQSAHVRDPATLEMFKESGNRIRSMALVHEKLYQSADLSRLDFTDYVRNLADLLVRSYQPETSGVTLRTSVEDVHLGIDAAVPLGLIINELVSNCLKYAYTPERRGEVRVESATRGRRALRPLRRGRRGGSARRLRPPHHRDPRHAAGVCPHRSAGRRDRTGAGGRHRVSHSLPAMNDTRPSILIVEDEGVIALDIRATLGRLGYTVAAVVATGREAIVRVEELRPDLVLMDIHLRGEMDGVEAARAIRDRFAVPVIYLTAFADPATLQRARITEPFGYLLKPFEERELHIVIEMALQRHDLQRRLQESERWLAATLRSLGDTIIATDAQWHIRFMNPAAEQLTGWSAPEAAGRTLSDVVRVSLPSEPRALSTGAVPTSGGTAQGMLVARDGTRIAVEETSTLIRDPDGTVIGVVIAIRDVSNRPADPSPDATPAPRGGGARS